MNKEVAKLWVEALRSGKYKQGTGRLQTADGSLCCLGVLCKIAPANVEVRMTHLGLLGNDLLYQPSVLEWSGLQSNNGDLPGDCTLAKFNDTGKSFAEIADIIEQNVEKL